MTSAPSRPYPIEPPRADRGHRVEPTRGSARQALIRITRAAYFVLLLAWVATDAHGAGAPDSAAPFTPLGRSSGTVRALAFSESHAYLGVGHQLFVFDVGIATDPRLIFQSAALPSPVRGIAVANGHAYMTAGRAGLYVYDIADPSSPLLVGSLKLHGQAEDVVVDGSHAYVTARRAGLYVVDVTDPSAPILVSRCDIPRHQAAGITLEGSLAYLTLQPSGLAIVDVADPAAPTRIGELPLTGVTHGIAVRGRFAYVAAGWAGLLVINVADPTRPRHVASSTIGELEDAWDVVLRGKLAYEVTRFAFDEEFHPSGLRILDVSIPTHPVAIGDLHGSFMTISLWKDVAYVAYSEPWFGVPTSSLEVLDVGDPTNPQMVGEASIPLDLRGRIVARDQFLYAINEGLQQFDLSDPHRPRLSSKLLFPTDTNPLGRASDVAIVDQYAFVGSSSNLHVVDLSDPSAPRIIAHVPVEATDVVARGNLVFASDLNGVRIVDVSNPESPTVVGTITGPTQLSDVRVVGDILYARNYVYPDVQLLVYDIRNPTTPTLLKALPVDGSKLEVVGHHAYLSSRVGPSRLIILDVTEPSSPTQVAQFDLENGSVIGFVGDTIYVAVRNEVRAIDISDPAAPFWTGDTFFVKDASYAHSVAVLSDGVRAFGTSEGLIVFDTAR